MKTADFGSVSTATMRPEDLIPAFVWKLERLVDGDEHKDLIAEANAIEDYDSEQADEVLTELFDALDEAAPQYGYFGANEGDGADYGFWLSSDWQQCARDDGVVFVDDAMKLLDRPLGIGEFGCVVNDHGNCTLYSGASKNGKPVLHEVWSIV